ncbi:MAG: MFS transporter [Cyclobacteriaceae bacterium]
MIKESKKVINAWCMYDWANSVYSLVITSAIFPAYYNAVTTVEGVSDVNFFGYTINNSVLLAYSLAFSFFFVSAILPVLSGIADYSGRKKLFLKAFMYIGAVSCIGLFWFDGNNIEWGIICSVLASVGYAGGLVFYDAYLPEIVNKENMDTVSAKGYARGYMGSVILMVFNIAFILFQEKLGFSEDSDLPTRLAFLSVGLWWIGFSQITFRHLPDTVRVTQSDDLFSKGYKELQKVFKSVRNLPDIRTYLISFFLYNMGVQTVMYLAATFAADELNLGTMPLITTILLIQLVAIPGAYFFARLSRNKGNKLSISVMLFIWIIICFCAYFVTTEYEFYVLAIVVGLVMGGIQALSRATYSKLIPVDTTDTASFFSFYDVAFYLSTAIGTLSFGLVQQLTGSMRNSTIALAIYFVAGFIVLTQLKDHGKLKGNVREA